MAEETTIDVVGIIMDIESEGFDPENEDHLKGVQALVDQGIIWKLQGSWQRLAQRLAQMGLVTISNG